MTNNQLALDFAREVMGWEDATLDEDGIASTRLGWVPVRYEVNPGDFKLILEQVQAWCDEHNYYLHIFRPNHNNKCEVKLIPRQPHSYDFDNVAEMIGSAENDDLSTALMTACLAAERKRIGAKGGEDE